MDLYGDEYFMQKALAEAEKSYDANEVPVGAIVVCNQKIIAKAHNQTELLRDVTAHAEIIAITSAASYLGSKYLNDCTMYVTLEPCPMCAGALRWAQIGKIIYGADDEKNGFMIHGKELLHPKTTVEFGLKHDACKQLMQEFFKSKRNMRS